MPMVGRFVSKDPLLFGGGQANLYAYAINDPINFLDPSGRKPGDSFATPGEAAADAINYINPLSISSSTEYGGWVYKNSNGSYVATNPNGGQNASVGLGAMPDGTIASYHTHGSYDNWTDEFFSFQDIFLDARGGVNGYLGTPSNLIYLNTDGSFSQGLKCPNY